MSPPRSRSARSAACFLALLASASKGGAPGEITPEAIISEGKAHSELMKDLEYLTDRIGPRLTGSKKFKQAAEWTAARLRAHGLSNVHLETFDFGRGWQRGLAWGRMVAPYEMQLDFRALAWTPGTAGAVAGDVLVAQIASEADLEQLEGKLKGKFILAGAPSTVPIDVDPCPMRMSDARFDERETAWPSPPAVLAHKPAAPEAARPAVDRKAYRHRLIELATAQGALGVIVDSGREYALLEAGSYPEGRDPQAPPVLPIVTMSHEHYSTLYRLARDGAGPRLELCITNTFEDEKDNACNVVGEIRGVERPDEVVVLGAHLDSWDLGTGATDDGAGSMAVLEAARILTALDEKPARTIRVILFGGEEQGLRGSEAYVQQHRAELERFSAIFVLDTGTGRIRGIGTQGNQAVVPIFQEILEPLRKLGVDFVNERTQIGTDHLPFEKAGVPGFAFFQDALDYKARTHHTQADTLDKILPDDLEQGAITLAVMAHGVAHLPALLPRKDAVTGALGR